MNLRQLLEQLHLLRRELEEEVTEMEKTEDQFNANLAKMRAQAEQKKRRVHFLELQVRAIDARTGRKSAPLEELADQPPEPPENLA